MRRRRVQQLQAATAERAEPVERAATSLLDKQEPAVPVDEAAPAAQEAAASQAEYIPTVWQAATPEREAPVEQVERQPLAQVVAAATAEPAEQRAQVETVLQRVSVGQVAMVRTVVPVVPEEAQAARMATAVMVAAQVTAQSVAPEVGQRSTMLRLAMVAMEAPQGVQAVPAEQQDSVQVLPEPRERRGPTAPAEWVEPAESQRFRLRTVGQSAARAAVEVRPREETAETVGPAVLQRRSEPEQQPQEVAPVEPVAHHQTATVATVATAATASSTGTSMDRQLAELVE